MLFCTVSQPQGRGGARRLFLERDAKKMVAGDQRRSIAGLVSADQRRCRVNLHKLPLSFIRARGFGATIVHRRSPPFGRKVSLHANHPVSGN